MEGRTGKKKQKKTHPPLYDRSDSEGITRGGAELDGTSERMGPQVCRGNQDEIIRSTALALACTSAGRGAADSKYIPHCLPLILGCGFTAEGTEERFY